MFVYVLCAHANRWRNRRSEATKSAHRQKNISIFFIGSGLYIIYWCVSQKLNNLSSYELQNGDDSHKMGSKGTWFPNWRIKHWMRNHRKKPKNSCKQVPRTELSKGCMTEISPGRSNTAGKAQIPGDSNRGTRHRSHCGLHRHEILGVGYLPELRKSAGPRNKRKMAGNTGPLIIVREEPASPWERSHRGTKAINTEAPEG